MGPPGLPIAAALPARVELWQGAGDAATWLPPNKGYRCTYAARQVTIKSTYSLWVTPAEHEALDRILRTC